MKQVIISTQSGAQQIIIDQDSEFLGLWLADGAEQIDLNLNFILKKENLSCRLLLKLIAFDQARIRLRTNFQIQGEARATDSFLKISALLCSDECKVDLTPALEIQANELKAGHSLAISSFDPQEIFYLQSHGLTKIEAENQLVKAFANDLIFKALPENQKILEQSYAKLEKRLEQAE